MDKTQDWLRGEMLKKGVTVGKSIMSEVLNDRRRCTWEQAKAMSLALGGMVTVNQLMDRVRVKRTRADDSATAPDAPAVEAKAS